MYDMNPLDTVIFTVTDVFNHCQKLRFSKLATLEKSTRTDVLLMQVGIVTISQVSSVGIRLFYLNHKRQQVHIF